MKANLIAKTIEMSKNEAKAAGRINSDKFKELEDYQNAYPNYAIRIIETPKRKSEYSGLNYKFMETYIKNCNRANKDEILKQFNTLRGSDNKNRSKCEKARVASYLEVKAWFLEIFSEIEEFKKEQSDKIAEILNVA